MKANKKQFLLLIFVLLFPLAVWSQYSGYVGETITLQNPRSNLGTITTMQWRSLSSNLNVTSNRVRIEKYFTGTEYVECWYQYQADIGYTYYGSSSEYYAITCRAVNLTISPSSLSMQVGESKKMSWSYSPLSAPQPKVEWSTANSNVAKVDNYGTITAVRSGQTTITARNSSGPDKEIKVTVKDIPVSKVTISSNLSVAADNTTTVSLTVEPSNATVKSINWVVADPNIASISGKTMTGRWPGETTAYCIVNGEVRSSNDMEISVWEPSFTFRGFSIENQASYVETKPTITATFSHDLYRGDSYSQIALTDGQGQKVSGSASISGSVLSFTPTKHLQPLTTYTLTIPENAVKNKWGTSYEYEKKVSFTTNDWQTMTVSASPEAKYLMSGDKITLTCSMPDATIYYSIDGSDPTTRYVNPITFENDMTLRAIAKLDGYYDSRELRKEYLRSVEMVEKWPNDSTPLYNYADVNPNITFSYPIEQGEAFGDIAFMKKNQPMGFKAIVYGQTLFIVPNEPLEYGSQYTINLPTAALVVTDRGEESQAHEWTFATGDFVTAVSMGGPELATAIKTNGSLWTWGRRLNSANAEDGSYSYDIQDVPGKFIGEDVVATSSGYMHHAVIMRDGSLWMWGRQLCGEFGIGSREASAQPVKVMDGIKSVSCGLQTTAIIKEDGSLWMCGRNDLGQIDDSRSVYTSYIKIAEDVNNAQLNWGSLTIEKVDGTIETRVWDEKADDGRQPTENGIDNAAQMVYGWKNAVALGLDGSVWMWGNNLALQQMMEGRNPQPLQGITLLNDTLKILRGEQAVVTHRPSPLLANYATLAWQIDNEAIATINKHGVITPVGRGKAIVTATIADDFGTSYQQTCIVWVKRISDMLLGDLYPVEYPDGIINGMDLVEIVDLVMSQGYEEAADLYPAEQPDGIVNGMDLVEEVDLVMSQTAEEGAAARLMTNFADGLTLTPQNGGAFALGVMTGQHYLITQCTVQLSDGMCLDDVTTDEHHTAAWKKTGENTYMVVAYSGRNRVFASNDALLSLHCTGEGTVSVTNVLMADENRQERHFAAVSAGTTTGISATLTNGKKMNSEKIYDLQGRRIGSKVRPGVYVVGGQKKMVK